MKVLYGTHLKVYLGDVDRGSFFRMSTPDPNDKTMYDDFSNWMKRSMKNRDEAFNQIAKLTTSLVELNRIEDAQLLVRVAHNVYEIDNDRIFCMKGKKYECVLLEQAYGALYED